MKKSFAVLAAWATAVVAIVAVVIPSAKAAPVFTGTNQFSGYSTGTVVHADLLQFGSLGAPVDRLVNTDVAFSGAAANTNGLGNPVNNEFQNAVSPAQSTKDSYGRGSGLELGLATSLPNNPNLNQLVLAGLAQASAPPSTPLVTKEVGPIPANPLLYASLLRGQAEANFDPSACVTDPTNVSFGLGDAADVQLLNTGAANPDGTMQKPVVSTDIGTPTDRAVSQAQSFMHLVPNGDGTFGLVSETHETVAPITLFKGTANEIRIELLGEWVLKATATGKIGGASVTYAPAGNPTPTTPLVRITTAASPNANVLTAQQLFGAGGLHIPASPLADIWIGEPARAIGDNSANPAGPTTALDGTAASGAVDVVRVKLLIPDPASHLADVRIGHMEADASVPSGGVACPAAATTTSSSAPSSTTSTTSGPTSTTTTPPNNCNYNGYSTGSDVHADLLQLPGPNPTSRLVNADVAFSGAATNTNGLGTPINNEFQNAVSPSLPTKNAYGRGSGLELGLGTSLPNNPNLNQAIIAGLAEASAPP
ncbi:MAG: hypothetical protein JOZ68_11825, partial [Acidimicrobiia bacterium]|nr:hypothetical protein [Acidimicrobiia bacterium]